MIELPEVLGSEPVYKGRLFDVGHARLRFSDGVETERAIVQHQGAVAPVVMDDDGRWLFVE